ncbi:hypothetical protein BGX28_004583 [Mortierella sp. GBA30]|nr:hypothetical protein BGX28_004583 [Mortierella sp. GBA30]
MRHAARTLSINTSNACLVNKFNSHNGRPYTPTPPSCRLHKIYEEKLEILGSLGHENWFDEHANPFYRHPEPSSSTRTPMSQPRRPSTSDASDSDSHSDTNTKMNKSKNAFKTQTTRDNNNNKITFSTEFTGFEPLDSDDSEEDRIDFFGDGFLEDEDEDDHILNTRSLHHEDLALLPSARRKQIEMEQRRMSNRNRIMDRGHLMPETTVYLPLPLIREPRFVVGNGSGPSTTGTAGVKSGNGGTRVRALSPYPRSRAMRPQD